MGGLRLCSGRVPGREGPRPQRAHGGLRVLVPPSKRATCVAHCTPPFCAAFFGYRMVGGNWCDDGPQRIWQSPEPPASREALVPSCSPPPWFAFQSSRDRALSARRASRALQALSSTERVAMLHAVADALLRDSASILEANAADVAAAEAGAVAGPLLQRLYLTPAKLARLAEGVRAVAAQPEPLGRVRSRRELAPGLELSQESAALGVVLVVFESRPDALPQIASLALRSGNGLLLKGGREAARSCAALHASLASAVAAAAPSVGPDAVCLVEGREAVADLLALDDVIDLVIPRGGASLVAAVRSATRIPVLSHADGVCHLYVDADADADKACAIAVDAKTDYPAACNAMETLLLHESLLPGPGEAVLDALRAAGVTLHGGPRAAARLDLPPADSLHCEWGTLDATVELVGGVEEALAHINAHGSGHTETIVTENEETARRFLAGADAACVHHNASSRFADGFRYGLGAEVGISTSRIHARGPVGVEGLLTTKFVLRGSGQVVAKDAGVQYTHRELDV